MNDNPLSNICQSSICIVAWALLRGESSDFPLRSTSRKKEKLIGSFVVCANSKRLHHIPVTAGRSYSRRRSDSDVSSALKT